MAATTTVQVIGDDAQERDTDDGHGGGDGDGVVVWGLPCGVFIVVGRSAG